MVRIFRTPKPIELTDDVFLGLTTRYVTNHDDAVWKQGYIASALRAMSFNKCSFCEMALEEEGKHLNIEHFHPKSIYPREVVVWENLLPSCNRCNSNKGTHDTVLEPIIDPSSMNPKNSLYIKNYRYMSKDDIGQLTIDVLCLNDTTELVSPRFKIGNAIMEKTNELYDLAKDYPIGTDMPTRRKNKVINGVKSLLKKSTPQSTYSAIVATVLLSDDNYIKLKQYMLERDFWNEEMTELENIAYDVWMAT